MSDGMRDASEWFEGKRDLLGNKLKTSPPTGDNDTYPLLSGPLDKGYVTLSGRIRDALDALTMHDKGCPAYHSKRGECDCGAAAARSSVEQIIGEARAEVQTTREGSRMSESTPSGEPETCTRCGAPIVNDECSARPSAPPEQDFEKLLGRLLRWYAPAARQGDWEVDARDREKDRAALVAHVARLRAENASKQELFDSLGGDYEKLAAEWSAAVAARDEAQRQLAIHDNWPCPDCEEKEVAIRAEAERAQMDDPNNPSWERRYKNLLAERALTPEEAAYIPPRLRFPSTIEDRPVWESIVAKCRAITGEKE